MGKTKAKAKAKLTAASENSPVAAPAPAPTSWKEDLTPEELEKEHRKQAERDKKAQEAADKQAKENERKEWWAKEQEKEARKKKTEEKKWEAELNRDKQRALQEGVLEAWDYGDGVYYVDLGKGNYKEVSGNFYCPLCDKQLNDSTLQGHINSQAHQNKVAWGKTCSPCSPVTAQPKKASAPTQPGEQCLEDWQEIAADGYNIRCKPCGKVIDELHLGTTDHQARLERWLQAKRLQESGYRAPAEPYLAWVPWDEKDPASERVLKCLLCGKLCQDEWSHSGSRQNPAGSKDHQKNLRNYGPGDPWWESNVTAVRVRWHPETAAPTMRTAAPTMRTAAGYAASPTLARANPAPWASAATPVAPAPVGAPAAMNGSPLPAGWQEAHDKASGKTYYYNEATRETTWSRPDSSSLAARPSSTPAPCATAAPAAQAQDDDEEGVVEC